MWTWKGVLRRLILFLLMGISTAFSVKAQAPDEPPQSSAVLIAKINGAGADAREEIAHSLARISPSALEPLITALRHRNPKVRGVAARALELMEKKAEPAVPALIAALADTEPPDDPKPKPRPIFGDWGRTGEARASAYQRALGEIGEPAVRALVKQLDMSDPRARVLAIRALGFVFDEKKVALPRLMALLEDPALRFEAATALGGISPAARVAIPRLIAALKDPDPAFRARSAETLGRIGWARLAGQYSTQTVARGAVAPLCELLEDADPRVRAAAATALGDIGPEAGVAAPRIIRMFKDPVVEVRLAALGALQRNGAVSSDAAAIVVPLLEHTDVRIRRAALSVIDERALEADQVFTAVVSVLADQDPQVKTLAMSLLSDGFRRNHSIGTISSLRLAGDALRRYLSETDNQLRQSAASLLAHFRSQAAETVPILIERLKDRDADVREAAARSLGAFGSKAGAAIPSLFERLYDPGKNASDRSSVAANAAVSIMEINPQSTDQVVRRVLSQLSDPDVVVAAAGVKVISGMGAKGSSILWRLLSDPKTSRPVRAEALQTLAWTYRTRVARRGNQDGPPDTDVGNAVPALRKLVRENDPDMGQNASELLAAILPGEDEIAELYFAAIHVKNLKRRLSTFTVRDMLKAPMIPFLVERLNDPDGEVRAELLLAIAKLARALPVPTTDIDESEDPRPPTPEEREKLADALRVKVQAAQTVLPLLKDDDPVVRWNAAALLGELGVRAREVVPALRNMLRTEKAQIRRNDRLIPLEPLRSNYSDVGAYATPREADKEDELRLAAVGALGRFGPDAVGAVPELDAILRSDKNTRTRWFTAAAIHGIGPAAKDAVPILIEVMNSREAVESTAGEEETDGYSNNFLFPHTKAAVPLKVAAAVALGGIGPRARAAVSFLAQLLDDADPPARAEAAFALGNIGCDDAPVIAKLVKLTQLETDDWVADRAGHALGKMGAKAILAMTEQSKVGDPDIRVRFITALGEAGPAAAQAIPALGQAAADPDEEIRKAAVIALGLVGKGPAAANAIPILIAALNDADRQVRVEAVWGLSRSGAQSKPLIAALVAALSDPDGEVASSASSAVCKIGLAALPSITALLADPNPALGSQLEYTLLNLVSPDPDLRPRGETRSQVAARIKEARAVVLSALKNPNGRVRDWAADRLANLGESIVPDLIAALGDASALLRAGAAQTLELIGPKARPAIEGLRTRLNDPDATVRAAADSAIKQITRD
jgi:HEAT repeat protein